MQRLHDPGVQREEAGIKKGAGRKDTRWQEIIWRDRPVYAEAGSLRAAGGDQCAAGIDREDTGDVEEYRS